MFYFIAAFYLIFVYFYFYFLLIFVPILKSILVIKPNLTLQFLINWNDLGFKNCFNSIYQLIYHILSLATYASPNK